MINKFGPYSPIRKAGNLFFVSGQVGFDPKTKKAPQDVKSQVMQALQNLENVINGAGLSLDHVVKTTIFLVDIGDFAEVNNVYESFFNAPRPARSTVAVKELPRVGGDNPILIEIEAIATEKEMS